MPTPNAVKEYRADLYAFLKGKTITSVDFDDESIMLVLDNGKALVFNGEIVLGEVPAKEPVTAP